MRYAVLSDTRRPTTPDNGHGLGRVACDIAVDLKRRGNTVTFFAGPDSVAPEGLTLVTSKNESSRIHLDDLAQFDGIIDCGHFHELSKERPELPIVDYVLDLECPRYELKRVAVANEFCRVNLLSDATVVPLGIDVDAIPFFPLHNPNKYLGYAGKIHPAKGYKSVIDLGILTGIPARLVGENMVGMPESAWYVGEQLSGKDFFEFIGQSYAFIMPSLMDAGGRGLLEAAATGAPSLVFDVTGTKEHVAHGISGWIATNLHEMAYYIQQGGIELLNRRTIREWVADTHSIGLMVDGLLELLENENDGTHRDGERDRAASGAV